MNEVAHVFQRRHLASDTQSLTGLRFWSAQNEGSGGHHGSCREIVAVRKAFGVSREEGRPPNITKLQNQHHDPLEPYSSTSVRRTSPSKAVDVVGHSSRVYAILLQAPPQMQGTVDALATGKHLLTTDKEIEGVADFLKGNSTTLLGKGHNNILGVPRQA